MLRLLVTGGGTGGHVSPALSVVAALKAMSDGQPWVPLILYVGSAEGVERRLADEAGLAFVSVQTGKLRRASTLPGYLSLDNLLDLLRIPVGVAQALWHVWRFKPSVVLSTGGYVCVPAVIAAYLLGVPILAHEQTVQVGLANRIAARFATRIALSVEEARSELPAQLQARCFVSGNPVRELIFQGDRARAVDTFAFAHEDFPTIYVTGGAQGARVINRAVEAVLAELLSMCRVIHQCGEQPRPEEQDYDRLQARWRKLVPHLRKRYYVSRYLGAELADALALSDLVVGRSGAGTVAELAALGKPSILIPLVPTGGDEQTRNARRLADAGAATIVLNRELDGPRLLEAVRSLLDDEGRLRRMGTTALQLSSRGAEQVLARALVELAR